MSLLKKQIDVLKMKCASLESDVNRITDACAFERRRVEDIKKSHDEETNRLRETIAKLHSELNATRTHLGWMFTAAGSLGSFQYQKYDPSNPAHARLNMDVRP